ncbi:uncharacterized protein BDR25DRAFT_216733 [Lindgomyces ingoldianus]|uniref:Uncharacterized protein n=1 Tax=Lindgomyces ingoldianus TaxID=673940 RepID=A0ACB6R4K5_9PLEO|nr:uncharacterized protein BDR25DRAFT_216733 [Lindgomyces ingoldianus]KAF2474259.1 hypothetical protein BDR25DRAFT_216733 [Lindgomyces ingoldianus]
MPLPIELVLNVIHCLLPSNPDVFLPSSHPITKTLLSFTLVCRETCRVASRYLRQYCVYLSSGPRLRAFLLGIPTDPELRNTTALVLAPFGNTIDDQPTATWVRELFFYTCSSLTRLIIDIPLRSLYPEHDHLDVRRILRAGFCRLENLEEFVSVRDELFLDLTHHGSEPSVWQSWPKLRRLGLYNVDADMGFWLNIAKMPHLETLVLTRADSLSDVDIKHSLFLNASPNADLRLKILIIYIGEDPILPLHLAQIPWSKIDPGGKVTVMLYKIGTFCPGDVSIETCQEWVRSKAEDGTLWDLGGEVVAPHENL